MITTSKYRENTVGVLGLGKTGISLIKSLMAGGAHVIAVDDKVNVMGQVMSIPEFQQSLQSKQLAVRNISPNELATLDALFVSPGVPAQQKLSHPLIVQARELNIPILSDLDLLYDCCPSAFYIGVTGTNGKSTTTALITHSLKYCIKYHDNTSYIEDVQMGGNIGTPALNLKPFTSPHQAYVLEVSSFQLDLLSDIQFDIAILLNTSPDHLDRYGEVKHYIESKAKIFQHNNKNIPKISEKQFYEIISVDYEETATIYKKLQNNPNIATSVIPISTQSTLLHGISIIQGILYINDCFGIQKQQCILPPAPHLQGVHNAENILANIATCLGAGFDIDIVLESLPSYRGLPHRMQLVFQDANFSFINDSKATNIAAVSYALSTYENIHWIVGGFSKDEGIQALSHLFYRVRCAYLIGKTTGEFAKVLDQHGVQHYKCYTLDAALETIKQKVISGNVLLSPACASLDQWKNYEERGDFFEKRVKDLFS
ncbi:UDP-N-acetylmuramoylalanine--D-glutamate ligase [Alphaproteobacteria bacterium]